MKRHKGVGNKEKPLKSDMALCNKAKKGGEEVKGKEFMLFVRTNGDKYYQVCLSQGDQNAVAGVVELLHNGKVRCFDKEFPFEEVKKNAEHKNI